MENRLRSNSKVIETVMFVLIIVFLFSNCVTTQFKIHSIELERREKGDLYFRMISDINFLDKQYEGCLIRMEYYPIDKHNPQRRIGVGSYPHETKVYSWDESRVKKQLDLGRSTFTIFFNRLRPEEQVSSEDFLFVGSRSEGMYEYRIKIPLQDENGSSWQDPILNQHVMEDIYELMEGNTYVFWGKIEGPVPFAFYGFRGIRSDFYRWEVTIPKK